VGDGGKGLGPDGAGVGGGGGLGGIKTVGVGYVHPLLGPVVDLDQKGRGTQKNQDSETAHKVWLFCSSQRRRPFFNANPKKLGGGAPHPPTWGGNNPLKLFTQRGGPGGPRGRGFFSKNFFLPGAAWAKGFVDHQLFSFFFLFWFGVGRARGFFQKKRPTRALGKKKRGRKKNSFTQVQPQPLTRGPRQGHRHHQTPITPQCQATMPPPHTHQIPIHSPPIKTGGGGGPHHWGGPGPPETRAIQKNGREMFFWVGRGPGETLPGETAHQFRANPGLVGLGVGWEGGKNDGGGGKKD